MRYRQPLQNKQQNASFLLQQLQLQKQRMEDKLNSTNEDTDYLLQLQKMTNMKLCKHNPNAPIPNLIASVAPHTFATIQPKISSGDYIKNKKMNALFNNQTFISCFVNNDNQKVNTKPILTQEEYVLYKDSLSSNCHSNRCDLRYKPYSNGSLISNLYTYQDLSGVDVIVEAPSAGSIVSSSTIYDNYIIDPDQVLFGTQATSTLFEYQRCKKNDTFTKQLSSTPQIVNLVADVSGDCNNVSVVLQWDSVSLQTYYITKYEVYKNVVLYATVQNNTYTFVGLAAGTPDTFTVVAYNNCGVSSIPVEITPEYPPSTPEITTITYQINEFGTYDITINWTNSSYPGNTDDSVSYHIYYEGQSDPPYVVSYNVSSYTFSELQSDYNYVFSLYASNEVGSSCVSQREFIPKQSFTFTYITASTPSRDDVIANLPFITSGGNLVLTPSNIITTITPYDLTSTQVVVNIPQLGFGYTFTDNGTTTDGLCFNATSDIHNYYFSSTVTSITINWFGDIPISRGGSQFGYNYLDPFNHPFDIEPVSNTNFPTFLTNTSFNYAFCNLAQFNSFIGFWDTTKVVSAIGTFKKCTIFNNGK
jgi:hypothetical protein